MDTARILLVDDNISIIENLEMVLQANYFNVDTAYNGRDALHKIESDEYDLVICDIEMPGISGLDFLSTVRKNYNMELDVILLGSFLEYKDFSETVRLGAADFIRKPIDNNQMLRSINTILKRKNNRNNFSELYNNLERVEFDFVLDPRNFSKFAVSELFNNFLQQNFNLSHNLLNQILICVDEMVYNAFIHGTLALSMQERNLDHHKLQKIINKRLEQPDIASKRMHIHFSICHKTDTITVTVEDQGPGFDYEFWINKVKEDQKVNLEESGRGISMLYYLSDKLEFQHGGRTVSISKKIPKTNKR